MKLILIRVILFSLIPMGVYFLIKGIRSLIAIFNRKILLEVKLKNSQNNFEVSKEGVHSIWIQGRLFKFIPSYNFSALNINTKEKLRLYPSLLGPRSNNGSVGKQELYTFSAKEGNYILTLESKNKEIAEDVFHNIQIRESEPFYCKIISILLIVLGASISIMGFVIGILADQIFF